MSSRQTSLGACIEQIRQDTSRLAEETFLYRGEPQAYPHSYSYHYRLFEDSNQFMPQQATLVKERLGWMAEILEVVLHEIPVYADPQVAAAHAVPAGEHDVIDVVGAFLQHYHLPTPLLDVTSDLDIAATFASMKPDDDDKEEGESPSPGALYVIRLGGLVEGGYCVYSLTQSRAERPRKQKAYSILLPGNCDLQDTKAFPRDIVWKYEFDSTPRERMLYSNPAILNASQDRVAREVAKLAWRSAYDDLAADDPRVVVFFANVVGALVDAGVRPPGV